MWGRVAVAVGAVGGWLAFLAVAMSGAHASAEPVPGGRGSDQETAGLRVARIEVAESPAVGLTVAAAEEIADPEAVTLEEDGVPRPVTVTPLDNEPLEVVVVVDTSEGVADELGEAVAGVAEFALRLPLDTAIGVVTAGGPPHVAVGPTRDTGAVLTALGGFESGGTPAVLSAVPVALDELASARGGREVLVVIGGGDNSREAARITRLARRLRAGDVLVFAIAVAGDATAELAASSGGTVEEIDDLSQVSATLNAIASGLPHLYHVESTIQGSGATRIRIATGEEPGPATEITVEMPEREDEGAPAGDGAPSTAGGEDGAGDSTAEVTEGTATSEANERDAVRSASGDWLPIMTLLLVLLALALSARLYTRATRAPDRAVPADERSGEPSSEADIRTVREDTAHPPEVPPPQVERLPGPADAEPPEPRTTGTTDADLPVLEPSEAAQADPSELEASEAVQAESPEPEPPEARQAELPEPEPTEATDAEIPEAELTAATIREDAADTVEGDMKQGGDVKGDVAGPSEPREQEGEAPVREQAAVAGAPLTEEATRYLTRVLDGGGFPAPGTVVLPDTEAALQVTGVPGDVVTVSLEARNRRDAHALVNPTFTPFVAPSGAVWFPVVRSSPLVLAPGGSADIRAIVHVPEHLPAGTYRGALLLQGFRDRGVSVTVVVTEPGSPGGS